MATLHSHLKLWETLRIRRELLGITQQELAEMVGVTLSAYTGWEKHGTGLTIEKLYEVNGALLVLEHQSGNKAAVDKYGDKPVDTLGKDCEKPLNSENEDTLAGVFQKIPPHLSPAKTKEKRLKAQSNRKLSP